MVDCVVAKAIYVVAYSVLTWCWGGAAYFFLVAKSADVSALSPEIRSKRNMVIDAFFMGCTIAFLLVVINLIRNGDPIFSGCEAPGEVVPIIMIAVNIAMMLTIAITNRPSLFFFMDKQTKKN